MTDLAPTISAQELPPAEFATFHESSFFSRNGPGAELPSPADVRARGATQDSQWRYNTFASRPVRYEELGLIVKLGSAYRVTVAEAQCLWALRRALPGVPVPEIYGWRHDEGQVFIYMELVPHSVTLEQRWDTLDRAARRDICEQLRLLVQELRTLRHAPGEPLFLGHVNREPLGDIVFTNENRPPAGPFATVAEFHDWMSNTVKSTVRHHHPGKELSEIPDPYRGAMPDDWAVVFTHADLHPSNIMVSDGSGASDGESSCKITALIDWRQSGWYPDYWEFCKAAYTADFHGEWLQEYIPLFLDEPSCWETFDSIAMTFGC